MTTKEKLTLQTKFDKKCRLLVVFCAGLILSLSLIKLVLINRAATWGNHLSQINQQIQDKKNENLQLRHQLAQTSGGLEELVSIAEKAGYRSNPQLVYFNSKDSVAQKLP